MRNGGDAIFQKNCWYAIGWGIDVGREILARTVWNQRIIMFRTEDGAAAIEEKRVSPRDFVLGIATSGTTPYVHGALRRARASLEHSLDALREDATPELVAMDLRLAANAVGEVVGKTSTEDLLDSIFSQFCIGK